MSECDHEFDAINQWQTVCRKCGAEMEDAPSGRDIRQSLAAGEGGDAREALEAAHEWLIELVNGDHGKLHGDVLANAQRDLAKIEAALSLSRPLAGEVERMREALTTTQQWLRAALDCKDWHWDPDQHEAAEMAFQAAEAALTPKEA